MSDGFHTTVSVLEILGAQVRVRMHGTLDETPEAWIARPRALPDDAREGSLWEATLRWDVERFAQMATDPDALFDLTPAGPAATLEELRAFGIARGL